MDRLIWIVNALETTDVKGSYEAYVDWCEGNGWESMPMRHYRHEISAIEQKWIVLDTMHRQIADDPQSETVSSEHILGALEDSAFAPSFETVIESLRERVLVAYQKQPPASASSL